MSYARRRPGADSPASGLLPLSDQSRGLGAAAPSIASEARGSPDKPESIHPSLPFKASHYDGLHPSLLYSWPSPLPTLSIYFPGWTDRARGGCLSGSWSDPRAAGIWRKEDFITREPPPIPPPSAHRRQRGVHQLHGINAATARESLAV
jgi:hypothetical protein